MILREIESIYKKYSRNNINCAEEIVTVRYGETDKMGVVYHPNYIVWFQIVRDKLTYKLDIDINKWEQRGFFSPVIEVYCYYKYPARYGDILLVQCISRIKTIARIEVFYRVLNRKNGRVLALGKTTSVIMNKNGNVFISFPKGMIPEDIMKELMDEPDT